MRSSRRQPFLVILSLILSFSLVVACDTDESSPAGGAQEGDPVTAPEGQMVARGGQLFNTEFACIECHSIGGEDGVGPPLDGIYGEEVTFEDGTSAVRDDAYLREAILDPDAHTVEGYPPGIMEASISGRRDQVEEEVDALIAFIRSLE